MLLASRSRLYALMLRRACFTSATQPQKDIVQIRKSRLVVPTISTLRPERLVHSDFLVFSGKSWPSFHTQLSLRSSVKPARHSQSTALWYLFCRTDGAEHGMESEYDGIMSTARNGGKRRLTVVKPFPEHAQGFLYLHQPQPDSGQPRSANSIRFRCVPSLVEASSSYVVSLKASPRIAPLRSALIAPYSSFKYAKKSTRRPESVAFLPPSLTNSKIYEAFRAGYDLTLPNGVPWTIPIVCVAGRPFLEYIRVQLLNDNLLSMSELREYEDIYKKMKRLRGKNLLHTLDDIIPVRFDKTAFTVCVMAAKDEVLGGRMGKIIPEWTGQNIRYGSSSFMHIFKDQRLKYGKVLPYTGAAHVRFELAPGSNPYKPLLFLRIVKITEPVECVIPDYDGHIGMPKEGELFTRRRLGKRKYEPWICQLNPSVQDHSAMLALVPGYVANTNTC